MSQLRDIWEDRSRCARSYLAPALAWQDALRQPTRVHARPQTQRTHYFHTVGRVTKIQISRMLQILSPGRIPMHPYRFGLFTLALALWILLAVVLRHQEGPARPASAGLSSTANHSLAKKGSDSETAPQTTHLPISHEQLFGRRARAVIAAPVMPPPGSADQVPGPASNPSPPLNLTLLGVYLHESNSAPDSDESSVGAALILDNEAKDRRLVRVGDRIGQWTLTRVSKRQITFTHQDQESRIGFVADTPTATSHPPSLAPSPPAGP